MQTQTIEFAVAKKGNTITQIGKSVILQPTVKFTGGSTKWLEDKFKATDK